MRPLIIDTNAFSAFKRADAAIIELIQFAEAIAISPIVIGELLFGFDHGNRAKQNRLDLQ